MFRGDKLVDEATSKRKIYIKKAQDSLVGYSYEILANKVLYDEQKQTDLLKEFIEYISKKMNENCYSDVKVTITALVQTISFLKDPTLRDEEEYRIVIHIKPNKEETANKKLYLRNVQYYRESGNKLFPFIKLRMETIEYVKSIMVGYMNNDKLSIQTMRDFLSTLPYDIELENCEYPLRW